MVEIAQKKKSQSVKILLLLPIGSKRRIIFLIVDLVYEYCRIASSIFVFTMSAISGVFNCLYSS